MAVTIYLAKFLKKKTTSPALESRNYAVVFQFSKFWQFFSLRMPRVRISWPHGCRHLAMVAGSWSNWQPQVLIPTKVTSQTASNFDSQEVWSTEVRLPDNVQEIYRYKFIVDGEWSFDMNTPHLPNDHGSFDNYIKVCLLHNDGICLNLLPSAKSWCMKTRRKLQLSIFFVKLQSHLHLPSKLNLKCGSISLTCRFLSRLVILRRK